MSRVLLATCAEFPAGDEDAPLLDAALRRHGVEPRWVVWDDPSVDWGEALVVLRSTWDYPPRRAEFLAWVRGLRAVANEPDVVEWSSDKTYLRDLARAGVPIVDTVFVAPDGPVPDELLTRFGTEIVIKPSVGAGSRGAGRFGPDRLDAARAHLSALHAAGRVALVQPYLADVDTAGETALVYVDGQFSHAAHKSALLPPGTAHPIDGRELFVAERMGHQDATDEQLAIGAAAMRAIREQAGHDQLYARVDLLPGEHGPVVIELELVEPSLFLQLGEQSGTEPADRFAAAVAARA